MHLRYALVVSCLAPLAVLAAEEKVTFNEHIRPILSENCFACHGVDATDRKAKLRLDIAEGATAERNGIQAIVPGNLEKSELWQRIISPHEDEVMPPPESHKKPLKPEERERIKRWIQQGAVYQNHWAYEPITRPAVPAISNQSSVISKQSNAAPITRSLITDYSHPVDAFVAARLVTKGLTLAPEASREVLLRRVTLDLTGLPPTTEEVDAFLADRRPDAYERVVDRLLASQRFGEQFARHWLDAVRYADTHGLHLDNIRTIWPYRDWVVSAFNRNLPYDQFTIEQLAGDLLPNPRIDQIVATGYNRCHLSTSEGGAIEPEAEARNTGDRVDTTAAVFLGLTANCASCHDHKFDPLTQKDYYAMGAIFKGLADRVWDGNIRMPGPIAVIAKDEATQRRISELAQLVKPLEAALAARADELEKKTPAPTAAPEPPADTDGAPPAETPVPAKAKKAPARKPVSYEVVWVDDFDPPLAERFGEPPPPGQWRSGDGVPVAGGKRALRLEGTVERPVIFAGGELTLTVRSAAKLSVHFQPDAAKPPRAVSLQFISDEKTKRVVWGDVQAIGSEVAQDAIVAGPIPPAGAYAKLEVDAAAVGLKSGKKYTGLRIVQSDGAGWWDRVGGAYTTPTLAEDPVLSKDAWIRSLREFARLSESAPLRHDIKYLVGVSSTQQNDQEKKRLARYHRDLIYGPLRGGLEAEAHAVRELLAEQIHYELTLPGTLVAGELAKPLPAHVLIRGAYDKPGEAVEPATPSFLPPARKSGERLTRLDFARWMVAPNHPLTSRVAVNRFWQQLFGAGIVRTPADFGSQGTPPTHPELLDWLASEFMRTAWDMKALVRLLVTSRTYRQDSRATPALLERDPDNKLLARGPRFRLDAEVLRDQALALSGLLVPTIGGPPVKPYQPGNIWEPVAFGGSNTKIYVQEHGEALYRRSLYTFWKRTAPAPSMSTFDAPSRESFCVVRGRSNTPLQALALMNDVQHIEAARGFAERLLTNGQRDVSDAQRLAHAFRSVVSRAPTKDEQKLLAETLATHRAHYAQHAEAARKLIHNGESKPNESLPAPEVAAWTMVANLLLNLDETVTRN